ncbi:MAG: porin, partial [Gammaproteobacteria bacterium]|nr:porin [Gammaproteobacteria bacterium]
AAAMVAPAAFAESTVYGILHTTIDANDFENAAGNTAVDNWSVESRSSRLGFKGSEDLGNGMKAIYQIELTIESDGNQTSQTAGQDGGDGIGGQRNTFVGLAGGFGTFLVGRHDTPMKVAMYASGNERLGDSILDMSLSNSLQAGNNVGFARKSGLSPIGVFSEYRADNGIAYISPNFSGFTLAAAVIPGEDPAGVANERDGIADHYSLGLMYAGGGLKASLGYQETEAGGETQETMQAGASYTFGAFSIGAQYEDTDTFGFTKNADYKAYAVTGQATFGNNAISLMYTDSEMDNPTGVADEETQGWGVAAEHNFSKRTKVYAAYAADSREIAAGGPDSDVDVFSLGMIHKF